MDKQILYSPYKNNTLAKKGKIFLSSLCDYGITFVLSMLVFALAGSPIFGSLPSTKEEKNRITEETTTLRQIVSETRLQPYDSENKKLTPLNDLAKEYIVTLTQTAYYLNNTLYPMTHSSPKEVSIEDTFLEKSGNYIHDRISYYYYSFKPAYASLSSYVYNDVDYQAKKEDFLYPVAFTYGKADYRDYFTKVTDDVPIYQQLDFKKAKNIAEYLVYGDAGGSAYYLSLQKAFLSAENVFIKEVENNYEPYLSHQKTFSIAYSNYSLSYLLSVFFSYVFAFTLCELFPLISKRKVTLGYHLHKLAYSTEEETSPRFHSYLVKSSLRLLMYSSVPTLVLFFFSQWGLLFVSFGYFRFLYLLLASLLLAIISTFTLIFGKNHQGLPELAPHLLIKDTEELEKGTPLEEKKGD